MNLYEKMQAITAEISTVAKNLKIESGKQKYKAVSEADVLAAVKPLEEKYKVYSYPCARQVVDSGEYTSKDSKRLFMRLETVYRFVDCENPADYLDITTYGDGLDSGDKAPGKAMTYADKYALLKAYKIQTGEDPDKEASPEMESMTPDTITDKEKAVLMEMCRKRGLNWEEVFPKGLNMTTAQYVACVKELEKRPVKEGTK